MEMERNNFDLPYRENAGNLNILLEISDKSGNFVFIYQDCSDYVLRSQTRLKVWFVDTGPQPQSAQSLSKALGNNQGI